MKIRHWQGSSDPDLNSLGLSAGFIAKTGFQVRKTYNTLLLLFVLKTAVYILV
jgi:hypothetical protein